MPIADARGRVRHVFLHDMLLDVQIGVYSHEQGRRQRVRISVDLGVAEGEAAPSDRLERVVDYGAVAERVCAIALAGHIKLVETLAERIAVACLSDTRVLTARIRVEKLDAFDHIGSAGIEIERMQAAPCPPPEEKP